MTPKERTTPSLLHSESRAKRLAVGAGVPVEQVKAFINQFETLNFTIQGVSSMTKMFSGAFGGGTTADTKPNTTADDDDGGFADFFASMMGGGNGQSLGKNPHQQQAKPASGKKMTAGFMNQFFNR
jgi:hypothetical protein